MGGIGSIKMKEANLPISLNHTIVPAYDKEASAKHIAHILGLTCMESMGHFAPVQVDGKLTLDFD